MFTITWLQLALYGGALVLLWLTPGPVLVALTARAMSGGFAAAWPLALGVVVGDVVWPLVAIYGLKSLIGDNHHWFDGLRWVAAAIFWVMGGLLIRHAGRPIARDSRLTRGGGWAGFSAGVAAILGNPKAILFYMGVLPGFFALGQLRPADVTVIILLSMAVPLLGNLAAAAAVGRARALLSSPRALAWINLTAGGLLIAVGVAIVAL